MQGRRKFILVPLGSAGDVLPFVWLAEGLRDAGHDVVAVVQSPFLTHFRAVHVRAVGFGSIEDHEVVIRHPDLWHPRRGLGLIARVSATWHRLALPLIRNEVVAGRTTVVGAGLAFAARIAAEVAGLPLVTIQLQPLAFLSALSPPVLRAGWEWLLKAPLWARRAIYRVAYWQTDWLWAETINNLRAEVGLGAPVSQVLRTYWVSPQRIVALFPDWFAPKAADWPIQTVTTRFPLVDPLAGHGLSPDVETFLAEGAPPVLFTPGSANAQASRFFKVAAESCRLVGCRGLLATPFADQVPHGLPLSVRHFRQVSFTRLFPRCRAVVHHGGIGTTSHALAAGTPQLIVPLSHDQPDNASRVRQLGVGDSIYPARLGIESLAALIRTLISSKDVGRACRDLRDRLRQQMEREQVVRLIEEVT